MKTVEEQVAFLQSHSSPAPSRWKEKAEWRRANKNWLAYSRKIDQGISQRELAERMGCSPQYISRILKGEENLSLETICKLEQALNVSIMNNVFE